MTRRVVFMGSPEFALPTLAALAAHFQVVGVVTQPDRPAGRGQELVAPPIKKLALQLNLPLMQPVKLRAPEAWEQLTSWQPDLIVVAAYGQILRQNVLDLPQYGCINVHASHLPRWRGASPIQTAIAAGDLQTGVTIMKMDAGIDTGDILSFETAPIADQDTAITLEQRLAEAGARLLLTTLADYLDGKLHPQPQPADGACYAPMLKKEDGELNPEFPAMVLERKVRAYQPWPGTYINWEGGVLKVNRASVTPMVEKIEPGLRSVRNKRPALATSEGWFVLQEVQPPGKKNMPGEVFLNGARNWKQI